MVSGENTSMAEVYYQMSVDLQFDPQNVVDFPL